MKRKIISFAISLCLFVFWVAGQADAATLSLDSGSGARGTNIILPVNLTSETGESAIGLQFEINYDKTQLIFNEVRAGQSTIDADKTLSYSTPNPLVGLIIVVITPISPEDGTENKNVIADGEVALLSFNIADTASAGETLLTFGTAKGADVNLCPLPNLPQNPCSINITTAGGKVTIESINHPPELSPIGHKQVLEGEHLEFTVTAQDPDLQDTVTITVAPLESWMSFDGLTFIAEPAFGDIGNYPITFTASDGSLTDEEMIILSVGKGNRRPEIINGPITENGITLLKEYLTAKVYVEAIDPDADALTYSWSASNGEIFPDPLNPYMAVYYPPNVESEIVSTIAVTVDDGKGGIASGNLELTVQPVINAAVSLNLDNNISARQGETNVVLKLELSSSEPLVSAIDCLITYDSARLNFRDITPGPAAIAAGKVVTKQHLLPNQLKIMVYALNNRNPIGDGTVAELKFDIPLTAPEGNALLLFSQTALSAPNAEYVDKYATLTTQNGQITIVVNPPPEVTGSNPVDDSYLQSFNSLVLYLSDDKDVDEAGTVISATKDGLEFANFTRDNSVDNQISLNIIPEGDGVYVFNATPRDNECRSGNTVPITITLDTAPPVDCSIQINSGAPFTNNTEVTLSLSAQDALSGVEGMQFSPDGINFTAWESYQTTKAWSLLTGDGRKEVYARFRDRAGNESSQISDEIVLDETAPIIIIDNPPQADVLTNRPLLIVQVRISEEGSAVAWVRVNGNDATFTGDGFSYDFYLQEGKNIITVTCQDQTGNPANPEVVEVTLDTQGPNLSISSPRNGSYTNDNTPLLIYDTDGEVTEILLDAQPILPIPASGVELPLLTEAEHTISITAEDELNNLSTLQIAFTVDTIAPDVVITAPIDGSYSNQLQVTLEGTVDAVAFSEIRELPQEGQNILTKDATDLAGNSASASIKVIRDTIAPVVVITAPTDGTYTNQPQITLEGTVDGAAFSEVRDLINHNAENTLTKEVTDLAGNTGSASIRVIHDDISPAIVINSPQDGAYINRVQVTLEGRVDAVPFSELRDLPIEGQNILTKDVTDLAGNSASASIRVIRDTIAPVQPTATIVTPLINGYTNQQIISLSGTKEPDSSILINSQERVNLDSSNLWEATFSLQEGANTLNITSKDRAGNPSSPAVLSVKLKTTVVFNVIQPTKQYLKKDDLIAGTQNIVVLFTIDDESEIRSKKATLVEGQNTISLAATDFLGNSGQYDLKLTLDSQAPEISITSHQDGQELTSQPITLAGRAKDATSGIKQVKVNGQAASLSGEAFTKELTLTPGANTITIEAEDNAGNIATSSLTLNYTYTAPPAVPIPTPEPEEREEVEEEEETTSTRPYVYVGPVIVDTTPAEEKEEVLEKAEEEPSAAKERLQLTRPTQPAAAQKEYGPQEQPEEYGQPAEPSTPYISSKETAPKMVYREEGKELIEVARKVEGREKAHAPAIKVKLLKSFLFWRVYKLELEGGSQAIFWKLKEKQNFPPMMRLDKRQGTIYGIIWGKQILQLDFIVATQGGENIEASCKWEVK